MSEICRDSKFILTFEEFLRENSVPYSKMESSYFFEGPKLVIIPVFLDDQDGGDLSRLALPSGYDLLYLYEDRWFYNSEILRKRILARLGHFRPIFARKCRVLYNYQVQGDNLLKGQIRSFLEKYHSYSFTKCKYEYALEYGGEIVAVATFSYPKKICREALAREYDSYEWIRYASLPGVRVIGGMGRLFKSFLRELEQERDKGPDGIEVMSYSDNEWSQGAVYIRLGFERAGEREPVPFYVDPSDYRRYSMREAERMAKGKKIALQQLVEQRHLRLISNLGSAKFLFHNG